MDITSPVFWVAVAQIIAIDIILGGDNAVVIALASRRLPDHQRKKAIFWGVFGAIALRVALIFFALQLLQIPFLKIVGGLLLFWIALKLMMPQGEDGHEIDASTNLLGAIKTIIVADAVMSLDNVIAISAAAKDSIGLVIFGLVAPLVSATVGLFVAKAIGMAPGDALLFVILCASASYIVAPAAMRHAVPESNPGLVELLSLGITFPFNITLGIPIYWMSIRWMWGMS